MHVVKLNEHGLKHEYRLNKELKLTAGDAKLREVQYMFL